MVLRDLIFIIVHFVHASVFLDRSRTEADFGGLDQRWTIERKTIKKAFKARRSAKYFPLRNKIRKLDYSLLDNPQDGIERQMPHLR